MEGQNRVVTFEIGENRYLALSNQPNLVNKVAKLSCKDSDPIVQIVKSQMKISRRQINCYHNTRF